MARKRRNFEIFSMSFLDCMCCGFGAVVLVFMIINAQVLHRVDAPREDSTGETARLEVEILEQRKNMVLAKNSMEQLKDEKIVNFTMLNGLSQNNIRVVLEDSRGDVWVGTDGGGVNRISGDVVTVIRREFGITQSAVSQHLRVLRESGFASVRSEGARRLYLVEIGPLRAVDDWLDQFRRFWETRLEALAAEVAREKLERA